MSGPPPSYYPQQGGYAPAPANFQYYPPPPPPAQQQSTTNVVVVREPAVSKETFQGLIPYRVDELDIRAYFLPEKRTYILVAERAVTLLPAKLRGLI